MSKKSLANMVKKTTSTVESPLSTLDKYDESVFQRQQYFPQPEKVQTEDERLEAERVRLGLKKPPITRKQSVQEHDVGPRYEISKLSHVHQASLDETNN